MCGRFVSAAPAGELATYFGAVPPPEALDDNFNVAPTNDVYAVFEDGTARHLDAFWWGLVPHWAKDVKTGQKMINARAETLATKSAYRSAFAKRRCLIPADGFYEWKTLTGLKTKQPYYIHRGDGEPLAFAGLWAVWRGPASAAGVRAPAGAGAGAGEQDLEVRVRSCTIITTAANDTMAAVHDRMPVILPASAWSAWLEPDQHDLDLLGKLLVPAPEGLLTLRPVSAEVNSVRNRGAHLIEEVELAPDGLMVGERPAPEAPKAPKAAKGARGAGVDPAGAEQSALQLDG
jgi:putative SOS response-associated peptidase YedK